MRRFEPSSELDLVPVMNLVTILIPFLLMASGMVAIAVVDTTVPATSNDPSAEDPAARPTVMIGSSGMALVAADGTRTDLDCAAPCQQPTDLDLKGLTIALSTERPGSSDATVLLAPADGVSYEMIIAVMDASREADFPNVVLAGEQ